LENENENDEAEEDMKKTRTTSLKEKRTEIEREDEKRMADQSLGRREVEHSEAQTSVDHEQKA